LPAAAQTIEQVAETPWNTDTLFKVRMAREAKGIGARSLKQLILDMEDEGLANAGVDVFEDRRPHLASVCGKAANANIFAA
jgi:type I restriction enzyme M protein